MSACIALGVLGCGSGEHAQGETSPSLELGAVSSALTSTKHGERPSKGAKPTEASRHHERRHAPPGPPGPVTGSGSLFATADTHIRQQRPNQNFGFETTLHVGSGGRRALVGFDAQAIGAALGGKLVRARLVLSIASSYDQHHAGDVFGAHRLRRTWGEGAATYNCAFDVNPWNQLADCAAGSAWQVSHPGHGAPWLQSPTDVTHLPHRSGSELLFDVTRDVACALGGHTALHGWFLKPVDNQHEHRAKPHERRVIELHSRESAHAPRLLLEWTNGSGISVPAAACGEGPPSGTCTPSAPTDTTCNGVDEDCDGTADEDFVPAPTACLSGACQGTGMTTCQQGVLGCAADTVLPIDDGNPCTIDVCLPAVGPTYTPEATGTPCADENACNGEESCNAAGVCVPGVALDVDDGNPCTTDSCDPSSGDVRHTVVAPETSCDDGDVCNGVALCSEAGVCTARPAPNVDDGNPCTTDVCDRITGVAHVLAAAGTSCADLDVCNGAERCDALGSCTPGVRPVVDDQRPCTLDYCDPVFGVVHQPGLIDACDDGDACNGTSVCNPSGECVHGAPPTVDDGNPCTADVCDPAFGVFHELRPVGFSCDDGNLCNGVATCNELGACAAGPPPLIDDGLPCTIDACSPTHGVSHAPAPAGIECAPPDVCLGTGICDGAAACITQPPSIDDGDPCTEDSCDPSVGVVHVAVQIRDDGNPCSVGSCDPALGVVHLPAPEGSSCSDADFCNGEESCSNGVCVSVPVTGSDDGNPCTVAVCDSQTGDFQHVPVADGALCGDEGVCGPAGACVGGDCAIRGDPIDDENACTVDVCDPASSEVQHLAAEPGSPCDNGNACDGAADECDATGSCSGTEELAVPAATELCRVNVCDAVLGIVTANAPRGTPCGPQAVCDDAGTCVPGAGPECEEYCALQAKACGGTFNYTKCVQDCGHASAGLCAPEQQAHRACVLARPTVCNPSECQSQRSALSICVTSSRSLATEVLNDCVVPSKLNGSVRFTNRPEGTVCVTSGCGPGTCRRAGANTARCYSSLSGGMLGRRCMTLSGPGHCVESGFPAGVRCGNTLYRPGACYDRDLEVALPPGTPCQLGACSEEGVCDQLGRCMAEPSPGGTPCEDKTWCTGPGTCAPPRPDLPRFQDLSYECISDVPQPRQSTACTEDWCDIYTGLVDWGRPRPAGTKCNDNNPCNGLSEVCNASGQCQPTQESPGADDGNPCTLDYACDPIQGYVKQPLPDGTACADGDPCNGEEVCSGGVCGTAVIDDPGPCVVRSCDPELGVVEQPAPAGTVCETSLNPCYQDARCDGASHCLPPELVNVDDGSECTVDSCTPEHGVQNVYFLPEDGNSCTVSECDPLEGVVHLPVSAGTPCADGNTCNGNESCDGIGVCTAGTALSIDDGNPCTADACDPVAGVLHEPARGGVSCSDENACNGEEICNGVGQCLAGTPPPVDDGLSCTEDSCEPSRGVVHVWVGGTGCDGPRWTTLTASAPSPRDSVAATFIPVTSELLLFGGENAGVALADTWLFDLSAKRWRVSHSARPTARAGAVAVYDDLVERVIVFGGVSGSSASAAYFDDVWEYDPIEDVWSELDIVGPGPAPRALAAAGYDSDRERVMVFGGVGSGGSLGDTWELDPTTGSWALRASEGPSARAGAAMAYDPDRQRMLVVGGAPRALGIPAAPHADVWEFDGNTGAWVARATTNSPPARTGHGMVYDSGRQRFRVFGGTGARPEAFSDTWEYAPETAIWQPLAPALTLPGRAGHAIGYDPVTGSTVVAAGLGYSSNGLVTPAAADAWRLDAAGSEWQELGARSAPLLTRPGLIFDHSRAALVSVGPLPATRRMVAWEFSASVGNWQPSELSGQDETFRFAISPVTLGYDLDRGRTLMGDPGCVNSYCPNSQRIWEWDGAQLTRGCDFPQMAQGASVIYDPVHRRLVAVGGQTSGYSLPQSWHLDLASCATSRGQAPAVAHASVVWDSQRGRIVLQGGRYGSSWANATWVSDAALQSWTQLSPGNAVARPPALPTHNGLVTMAYDPVRARAVWFGGYESTLARDPVTWELELATGRWQAITSATGPKAPASATFDAGRGNVVLLDADGNLWDFTGDTWVLRELILSPPARSGASAAWIADADFGVMFGGVSGTGQRRLLGDTWVWKNGWKPASDLEANPSSAAYDPGFASPSPRTGHAFASGLESQQPEYAGLLFGGEGDAGLLDDTWIFNRETYAWSAWPAQFPAARTEHALAVLPGVGYLLVGGLGTKGPLNDTFIFQYVKNTAGWSREQLAQGALAPRWGHAMATDLERGTVLLFGGRDESSVFGDTWEFRPSAEPRWLRHAPRVSPPARFGHELVYDPVRRRIILTGGSGSGSATSLEDTWDWDADEDVWIRRGPEHALPARAGHVAFFDSTREELVAFGGLAYADGGRSASTFGDTLAFENALVSVDEAIHLPLASRCAHAEECDSGLCVDGVCCNASCSGQCSACDVPGQEGRCTAVLGAPHGSRTPCSGTNACQQCGGVALDACGVADGETCGPTSCTNGALYEPGECSAGLCSTKISLSCAPYGCSRTGPGCASACYQHSDCFSSDYFCRSPPNISRCQKYATVQQVTLPSPTARVGRSALIRAWVAEPPATFRFSYLNAAGSRIVACPATLAQTGECSFVPAAVGTMSWRVEVTAPGSPKSVDGSRDFSVTVLP